MQSRGVRYGWLLAALWLAGCATAPPGTGDPDPWRALTANLPADRVRALLGEPAAVRPMKSSQGPAEIWTYRRLVPAGAELVATSMKEVAIVDTQSGEPTTRLEPDYSQESRTVTQELQLLIFDGKLVSWTRTDQAKRDYYH